jgi:hypothetical protein
MPRTRIKAQDVLAHIRHKEITGELPGGKGTKLFIVLNAIDNKDHAQMAYEAHLREMAYEALTEAGYATTHYDLEGIKADILNALGVRL